MRETGEPGSVVRPVADDDAERSLEKARADLKRAVSFVCPGWLSAQAEDLVQIATIRLLESSKKSGGTGPPGPSYLRKVAYSVVVDEIRRRYRSREVTVGEGPTLEMAAAGTADPEREARSRELGRGITRCLERLRENRRRVVTLHLQGYTVPEIARSMGWTVKRTEHLASRGIHDVRQCLARKGLRP